MKNIMNWQQLLSNQRLGKDTERLERERTAFQKDVDRIIFSSAFRRLQDKTQVFPLAQNDYVRTRLTHSLEVSSVGRSLGNQVGEQIIKKYALTDLSSSDFGSIVAAACLSHDIGNPPFGHFGEEAIRVFFTENPIGQQICHKVDKKESADLQHFEGNAQGFRIVTQLQNPDKEGGLELTFATLGAFTKYPCTVLATSKDHIAGKKNGLLQNDLPYFVQIAKQLGLIQYSEQAWARHPLVYLMEAADDICYAIIDIEDAHQIKQVDYDTAFSLLSPLAENYDQVNFSQIKSNSDKISYLRAKAIGCLVQQTVTTFLDHEEAILAGQLKRPIAEYIPLAASLQKLTQYAAQNIYNCPAVVETEMAGYRILNDLLEMFCFAIDDIATNTSPQASSKMLVNLLPSRFIGDNRKIEASPYLRTLKIIDFISGMTDSYAVSLYQKLTGIKFSR